ncbi:hypothetical protein XCR1_60026 [Xenorhabdus cabanillasii JM26]|uniref:Uncharacterized protein n=1 Tax=Xenorhabdus cabanillasii JM26 TaxID=1427517 RepID=W1J7R9_9GAMM|nr:hypothetical protein XCR1_60026 [Xenorhabdus cabanillasii JM26]
MVDIEAISTFTGFEGDNFLDHSFKDHSVKSEVLYVNFFDRKCSPACFSFS